MKKTLLVVAIGLAAAFVPPEPTTRTATDFTEVVPTPAPVEATALAPVVGPEQPQTAPEAPSEPSPPAPTTEPAPEPPAAPEPPELPTEPVREPDTTNRGGRSVELN